MGQDTTITVARPHSDPASERSALEPVIEPFVRPPREGSADAPPHLARAQQAVARAREVAARRLSEAGSVAAPASDANAPAPHLTRAQNAVARARELAARYRATYGPDAPAAADPEKQPRMPELPWEKQKLKLDLPGEKQPLRLDLPQEPQRRRLHLAAAETAPLHHSSMSAPGSAAGRFARTSAAAERVIPDDPSAEPWSCLPIDQLRSEQSSLWQRLLRILVPPAGRRPVGTRPPAPSAERLSNRAPANRLRRHGPEPGPLLRNAPEPQLRRVPLRGAPRARPPSVTGTSGAADVKPDNEPGEPPHLPTDRAPVPVPRDGFERAVRVEARRRGLAQVLAWLFGRGSAGNPHPAHAARASQKGPVDRDDYVAHSPGAIGGGALTVVRAPALPMPLHRPSSASRASARGRHGAASWRLATRTLLVGGLGVLCGALLTELVAQPRSDLLDRVVGWWRPEATAPAPPPDESSGQDRPGARQAAEPQLAAPPEPAGSANPAVAVTEIEPAAAGPPVAERPVPVPRPVASDGPNWPAIRAALQAAQDDPGSEDLARIIRADPHRWDAFYDLGHRLQVRGHLRDAGALYREAARIDPTHAATFYDWGYALQQLGDQEGAIDKYRTAIRLNSQNPYAFYNLGFLLQRQGDLAGAIEHYQVAADLDLRNPFLYFNWGTVLERQGDIAGAIARYREASRLQPDASPGTDARVRIAELSAHAEGAAASN